MYLELNISQSQVGEKSEAKNEDEKNANAKPHRVICVPIIFHNLLASCILAGLPNITGEFQTLQFRNRRPNKCILDIRKRIGECPTLLLLHQEW